MGHYDQSREGNCPKCGQAEGYCEHTKKNEEEINTEHANDRQIGGGHYRSEYQHWDWVMDNNMGYLEGCASKYVSRWKKKNGVEDLKKAKHYIEKIMEAFLSGKYPKAGSRLFQDESIAASVVRSKEFDRANDLGMDEGLICWTLSSWEEIESLIIILDMTEQLIKKAQTPLYLQAR